MSEHNGSNVGEINGSVAQEIEAQPTLFRGMTIDEWVAKERQETAERIEDFTRDFAPRIQRMRDDCVEREAKARRGYLVHRLLVDAGFKPDNYSPTYIDVTVDASELPRLARAIGPFKVYSRDLEDREGGKKGRDMVRVTCKSETWPELSIHYKSPLKRGGKCKIVRTVERRLACDI